MKEELKHLLNALSIRDGRLFALFPTLDILLPFGFILSSTSTWMMGSIMMLPSGGRVGRTQHTQEDWSQGEEMKTGLIHGQVAFYYKPVVIRPDLITRAYDVYCSGRVNGGGKSPWDPLNSYHRSDYMGGNNTHDVFVIPMWNDAPLRDFFPLTGKYHSAINATHEEMLDAKYEVCSVLCQLWGWDSMQGDGRPP